MNPVTAHPLLPMEIKIPGAPRTKKNHGKVVMRRGRKFHVPSDAYTAYARQGYAQLMPLVVKLGRKLPIPRATRVNCAARFFRDANAGDAVGYYQGLADLLQLAGILADDVSIVSWDGSKLLKDAANPRVELVLEEVAP